MDFLPIRYDMAALADYQKLFALCFPHATKFTPAYLAWLYCQNPDGHALGFDAWDGAQLAAHYVCIPAVAEVQGEIVRVLLSLNTATHPNYQGRGLFTQLAELTYAAGQVQGFAGVYGIANANSTPGFIRKLGFQLVRPLQAGVGIGALGIDFSCAGFPAFRRVWGESALAWRCANPCNPISVSVGSTQNHTFFTAPALLHGGIVTVAELPITATMATPFRPKKLHSPLRLFIGCIPKAWQKPSLYLDIPQRLRPSPLNMIYRGLAAEQHQLDPESILVNFLDFDAY